jgi:hypothetical protein
MNDITLSHFVSGQVLGAKALNSVVSYLEEQDRTSRRALSGIGVVCGFEVDVEDALVHISKGVAVTSQGYLITDEAQSFDRIRPYALPLSDAEEATEAQLEAERYPFFFDPGGNQIPLFELVDTDFAPAPGEEAPEALTPLLLANRTVVLFLELQLASLKSCDINDCSDKGAELRFTLRRLLLTQEQAHAIIAQEEAIAGHPVERATHPMNELIHLRLEKLKIAATGTNNYADLVLRIVAIALKLSHYLPQALRDARDAYDYLVADLWPEGVNIFPSTYFSIVWGQLAENIFHAQYFYDYMRDAVMAYNEFVTAAARYEQACLPHPGSFPRHVLIGDAVARPDAVAAEFPTTADVVAWNPASLDTGAGLGARAVARRTHFIPSPAHTHDPRYAEVRSLFLRLHQLALAFRTRDLALAPIRLTPSKSGEAPLSDRAIPFYYAAAPGGVLHLNWSYPKTRARLLNTVYAYQFSAPDDAHPLHFRLDGQDFIRVEGIVGKPLGSAMAQLVAWKQQLGLSFSLEPVFMPLSTGTDDVQGNQLDETAQAQALLAARQLLLCRLSDIDLIFLIVLRAIYAFLVLILRRLSSQPVGPGAFVAVDDLTATPAAGQPAASAIPSGLFATATAARFTLDLPPREADALRTQADTLREEIIARPFSVNAVLERIAGPANEGTAGALFARVADPAAGGNLFDRTRDAITAEGGDERDVVASYAALEVMSQTLGVMNALSVNSLADFEVDEFGRLYAGFTRAYLNYANRVRTSPAASPEAAELQASIAGSADLVASQAGVFAAANINSEISAALQRLFEALTLDGYARRHPGLEHHAGVEVGGTLVLAYVSVDALIQQAQNIGMMAAPTLGNLATNLVSSNGLAMENAAREVTTAHAAATRDPLDRFIVLADFSLPYQCCDTDCSDRYIRQRFSVNPFGPNSNPGPMGVPPFDTDARGPGGGRGGGIDFGGPGDFTGPFERPMVNDLIAPGGIRWRPGDLTLPETDGDGDMPGSTPGTTAPLPVGDGTAGEITRERALLRGIVALQPDPGADPVPDTEVILSEAGAATRRVPTDRGRFEIPVRSGMLAVGAASPNLQGSMMTLHLDPGEEHEIVLVVRRRGG